MIPTLTLRPTAAGLRSRLDTEDGPIDGVMPPPSRRRLAEPLQRAVNWTSPYAAEAVRQVGAVLEEALAPDVREALEGFPDGALLRLDVARELARLPWEWCHQTGDPIGLRLALARTALGLEPDDDASAHPATGPSPSLLLLANPTGNLPGALDEASAIADAYADAGAVHEVLEGADATAERFIAELQANRWDVVHFAGHGWFDDEESYLVLAGGHRVRASELASLLGRQPPALLLLNTHFSGYVPPGVEA
ncbi:MAG: CHAT domain-containing protein, partial [Acidobacteria bacterium]|nr:CHAT domain-containing protein [Acidobacteriota bacterium]